MPNFHDIPPKQRLLPLSCGIEAAIIDSLQACPELTQVDFVRIVQESFSLVHSPDVVIPQTERLIEVVVNRLERIKADQPQQKVKTNYGKTLGTQFNEWLNELDIEQLCVYLADYYLERAYQMYWHAESEWVLDALKLRSEHDSQNTLLRMEACLYGFGGKYEDDNGGSKGNFYDINNEESLAALRSLGF